MASCKVCKTEYQKRQLFQTWCSLDCAVVLANRAREKRRAKLQREAQAEQQQKERAQRDKLKIRKLAVKPLSYFARQAQVEFNKFIRERDINQPCISCQRHHRGQYHAGHYRTVGANLECRFNEDNCHRQCSACNNYLSGNIENYRRNLIIKIGQVRFDALMGKHPAQHRTRKDFEQVRDEYKARYKALKQQREAAA